MQLLITILVTFLAGMGAGLGTGFAGMSAAAVISPVLITFLGMDPYMAVGIALPFSPLASYLQLQPLPLSYFPWLVAILVGYMTLTQMVKGFFSRRYGWQ